MYKILTLRCKKKTVLLVGRLSLFVFYMYNVSVIFFSLKKLYVILYEWSAKDEMYNNVNIIQ